MTRQTALHGMHNEELHERHAPARMRMCRAWRTQLCHVPREDCTCNIRAELQAASSLVANLGTADKVKGALQGPAFTCRALHWGLKMSVSRPWSFWASLLCPAGALNLTTSSSDDAGLVTGMSSRRGWKVLMWKLAARPKAPKHVRAIVSIASVACTS